MGAWKHRLTDVNAVSKTAICASCGPVRVRFVGSRQIARCDIARVHSSGGDKRGRYKGLAYERPIIGTCPICTEPGLLVWDHNHVTGKKRGHICGHCNRMLGSARDNIKVLQGAIAYLKKAARNSRSAAV